MSYHEIISESEAIERYNDILDSEGSITVAGISLDPSYILRECDPIAYDCGFHDFCSSLSEDGIYVEGLTDSEIEVSEED